MQQQQAEIHRANFCDATLEHVYRPRFHFTGFAALAFMSKFLTQTQLSQRLVFNSFFFFARLRDKKLFWIKKVYIQKYPSRFSICIRFSCNSSLVLTKRPKRAPLSAYLQAKKWFEH